ncbi:MAG: hypothetical protein JSV08_03690 [Acidobacteriota bacterium]|nr:MAG: hypothetical protein JSV08_03690 [Acidobacteriota bacterium]
MAIYSCPHAAHKDNPAPLAENAEGVLACVMKHRFALEEDEEMGQVLRDLATGVLHEVHPLDISTLQYRPEKTFEAWEMDETGVDIGLAERKPKEKSKSAKSRLTPGRPTTPPQKKVRKISTASIPSLQERLNFNALDLSPLEWKIIARVDGHACVKDVIEACRIEAKEAYDTLGNLIKRGIVVIEED